MLLRERSFKIHILSVFLLLISFACFCIIWFSYFRDTQSIQKTANSTIESSSKFIIEKVDRLVTDMEQLDKIIANFYTHSPDISLNNKELISDMIDVSRYYTSVYALYFGQPTGNFFCIINLVNEGLTRYFFDQNKPLPSNAVFAVQFIDRTASPPLETYVYLNDNKEEVGRETSNTPTFDPRDRPWYKGAVQEQEIHWTGLYAYAPLPFQGISVTDPIFDAKGQLIAVAGADLTLNSLGDFLLNLKIGKEGKAFILNSSGNLVVPQIKDTSLVDTAYKSYSKEKTRDFSFDFGKTPYLGSVHPFVLSKRSEWLILIAVPEDDFFHEALVSREETVFISLAILLIAGLIVYYFSKRISDPIVQLALEADKIKRFELESNVKIDSHIREISMMANSMSAMRIAVNSFAKYIPKDVVKQLLQKGEEIKLGGEKKKLSILFTDISGFTPIAESYDPEKLILLLSEYFNGISHIILEMQGTIDKFIGDGIMAFWGAPREVLDPSEKACLAALNCLGFIKNLNEKYQKEGKPQFFTRFGIHTGNVIVGNIGTPERINYTVMGGPVNIAARLQTINKDYRTQIMVTEEVKQEAGDAFLFRPLDEIIIRGLAVKRKIYELMAIKLNATPDQLFLAEQFPIAFDHFQNNRLQEAKALFEKIRERCPNDYPTQLYLDRLKSL